LRPTAGATLNLGLVGKRVPTTRSPLAVTPLPPQARNLVVPSVLETTVDNLYRSTNVVVAGTSAAVTVQPSGNSLAGKYQPLISPYLSNGNYTGNSTTQWYLFCDPASGISAFKARIEADDTGVIWL
jgi:hypothetical protein